MAIAETAATPRRANVTVVTFVRVFVEVLIIPL